MADNTVLNPGTGGDTIATDELAGGVKIQRVKAAFGGDGSAQDVDLATPLPVRFGNPSLTPAQTSVGASATSVTLLAANPNRKRFCVVNDSTATLEISVDGAATATNFWVALGPGDFLDERGGDVFLGEIFGVWTAVNGAARVTEFV